MLSKIKSANFPTIFVIFGATGDLSRKKLFPALFSLYEKALLPDKFSVVAFSRRPFSHEDFRQLLKDAHSFDAKSLSAVAKFLKSVYYVQGMFDDLSGYQNLATALLRLDQEMGQCSNKLFHLAVPPSFYPMIFKNLSDSGLTVTCGPVGGWTRILVEKPFGHDSETAHKLDQLMSRLFQESQIFRIDHYLAKEAVQNILAFRFFNPIFESVWDRQHIESVHVLLSENQGLYGRGELYDKLGAVRDTGQNHLLQMLALVAMDMPTSLSASLMRKARAKVLKQLMPVDVSRLDETVVRGQCEQFLKIANVNPHSQTETYFHITAYLKSRRWSGVPFYLESGKWLANNKTEITVHFKHNVLLENLDGRPLRNKITFSIQPKEAINIDFLVKKPGFEMDIGSKNLSFSYGDFGAELAPLAYERVLYDCVRGDHTLFPGIEEIQASWDFITPIVNNLSKTKLYSYKPGIFGKQDFT